MPLIPGSRMSRIRHAASSRHPESQNSSAEAKVSALNPNERRSRSVESRNKESSSTKHTSGFSETLPFALILDLAGNVFPAPKHSTSTNRHSTVRRGILLYLSTGGFITLGPRFLAPQQCELARRG